MKKKAVLFWIKSSRGTNDKKVYLFDHTTPASVITSVLETWCATHNAWATWVAGENVISYGCEEVSMPSRDKLEKQYKAACKEKNAANEKWARLAAMLSPREYGT